MAGHSKWANIKHKKAANDKKRAKVWTKIIREVTVAAREGQTSDPNASPSLRLAVDKALASNMPKDTIERACKRGSGELGGEAYDEIRYEGYGPGGVAVIVECMSDNRNRTVSEVRHAFTKAGGNLGTDGSVSYMFNQIGVLIYAPDSDEDAIMGAALEAGADDVVTEEDGSIEVITDIENFTAVQLALTEADLTPEDAEIIMRADNLIPLDASAAEKLLNLVDRLDVLDDVQEVFSNADIPNEMMES